MRLETTHSKDCSTSSGCEMPTVPSSYTASVIPHPWAQISAQAHRYRGERQYSNTLLDTHVSIIKLHLCDTLSFPDIYLHHLSDKSPMGQALLIPTNKWRKINEEKLSAEGHAVPQLSSHCLGLNLNPRFIESEISNLKDVSLILKNLVLTLSELNMQLVPGL